MAWSVVDGVDKPFAGVGFLVNAVERAVVEGDVPFLAGPGRGGPPVAGGFPGAGVLEDVAADARGGEVLGSELYKLHFGVQGWAEEAHGEAQGFGLAVVWF